MKGIEKFFHTHKKSWIIGIVIVIVLLLIFFTIFFIIPSFGDNNYGSRLDGIEDHKVSSNSIKEIKENVSNQEGVTEVKYHQEGRILNFEITVDENVSLDKAKEYANTVLEGISKKNLKYYDVQVFLKSTENRSEFPTAGYKHKTADALVWANVGEESD